MKIINLSDLAPDWNWLRDEFIGSGQEWSHISSRSVGLPGKLPKRDSISRAVSALRAVIKARRAESILVSHGPRPGYYGSSLAKIMCPDVPHLVYSFNFTDLPQGHQRKLMAKSFTQPTKFVTYSTVERALYAEHFDIPIASIDMLHWSVHPPKVDLSEKPLEAGSYICAIGSQARDYRTLFSAMKGLPNIRLVVVANAESIQGLEVPDNVKIYLNIPLSQAENIISHSQFMVLPLRDSQVPCGHVTLVSGMFFGKCILATNSLGVQDYIKDGDTGLFFESKNPVDLAIKIESLWEDASKTAVLSARGLQFAHSHCTEKSAVNYFANFVKQVS